MSEKISAMPNGNPAQSGDVLPIVRGGANFAVGLGSAGNLALLNANNAWTGNETHSGTEIFANGTPNPAMKPIAADSVQYVSINTGNDSNDGLSWGTAKLTIAAAITALNAPITGGGTVNIAAGAYAGGVTVPSGVRIFGSGMQATEITAPNGAAAF